MKTRILSIILILLLCLTAGCGKVSQESEKPDGISSSESKTEESSVTEFSEEGEQSSAPTAEQQRVEATDSTTTEGTESDTQAKTVSVQPQSSTTPPQASEPQQKSDESVSRSKTPSNPVPQQPVVEKTTEPTEQPQEDPAEPAFDIGYWISFAQSYAESVGLTLDSGAVYCWDNPIAAGTKCNYTERDIKGYLNRYAKDGDITDVWIWYEQVSDNYFEVYIGYA